MATAAVEKRTRPSGSAKRLGLHEHRVRGRERTFRQGAAIYAEGTHVAGGQGAWRMRARSGVLAEAIVAEHALEAECLGRWLAGAGDEIAREVGWHE